MKGSRAYEKATVHYTPAEWHRRKAEFVDLWIRQDLSLAEVAKKMRGHSFHATERQWKRKAAQWSLRKYTPAEAREMEIRRSGLSSQEFLRRKSAALEACTSKDGKEIKQIRRFLRRRQRADKAASAPSSIATAATAGLSPTVCQTSEEESSREESPPLPAASPQPPLAQISPELQQLQAKCPMCDTVFQGRYSGRDCRKHIASTHDRQLLRCALTSFRHFCAPAANGQRMTLPIDPQFRLCDVDLKTENSQLWASIVAASIPSTVLRGDSLYPSETPRDHKLCLQNVELESTILDALLIDGARLTRHARQIRELFQGSEDVVTDLSRKYEILEREFFKECCSSSIYLRRTVQGAVRQAISMGSQEQKSD